MSDKNAPRVALFLADGCEEIEALTVADILYRAGIVCTKVSITDHLEVTSSHGITVLADTTVGTLAWEDYTMIVLPGGVPGTPNLASCEILMEHVRAFAASDDHYVAAICAAPSILAGAGLLTGRNATCNPCVNEDLIAAGAYLQEEPVVRDGNIITSRAFGTAIPFGLMILGTLMGEAAATAMADRILYTAP